MTQFIIGAILLLGTLALGFLGMEDMILFRLIVGLILGYTLVRGAFGFAGSVNRSVRSGSSDLMVALMKLFMATAVVTGLIMIVQGPENMGLWINQINLGLVFGALLFGIGMAMASCCASGVLTDMATSTGKALVTLLFFGMGVFIAFPLQGSLPMITDSLINVGTYGGVFLPDLFPNTPFDGILMAMIITVVLGSIVIFIARKVESKKVKSGKYDNNCNIESELVSDDFNVDENYGFLNKASFNRIFVQSWSLKRAAGIILIVFVALTLVTGSGWGASTPFGMWFGQLLHFFGVPLEAIAEFTGKAPEFFTLPFFEHAVSVQNFGIIVGGLVAILLANKFSLKIKMSWRGFVTFAIGGLLIGIGTRFANGCNVGALFTPIANFSLSGWIFLPFMVLGGMLGNKLIKKWMGKL